MLHGRGVRAHRYWHRHGHRHVDNPRGRCERVCGAGTASQPPAAARPAHVLSLGVQQLLPWPRVAPVAVSVVRGGPCWGLQLRMRARQAASRLLRLLLVQELPGPATLLLLMLLLMPLQGRRGRVLLLLLPSLQSGCAVGWRTSSCLPNPITCAAMTRPALGITPLVIPSPEHRDAVLSVPLRGHGLLRRPERSAIQPRKNANGRGAPRTLMECSRIAPPAMNPRVLIASRKICSLRCLRCRTVHV